MPRKELLEEAIVLLEEFSPETRFDIELSSAISKLISEAKGKEETLLKVERKILSMGFSNGRLISDIMLPDRNGNLVDPSKSILLENKTYISERFDETRNDELKIKYGYVLRYVLGNKRLEITRALIDVFHRILSKVQKVGKYITLEYAYASILLSREVKYKDGNILDIYMRLITQSSEYSIPLIRFLVEEKMKLDRLQYETLNSVLEGIYLDKLDQPSVLIAWDVFSLGDSIQKKLNNPRESMIWHKRQGECYLKFGLEKEIKESKEKNPTFMGAYFSLHDALGYANKSGDKTLIKEVSIAFTRIKEKHRLPTVILKFDEEKAKKMHADTLFFADTLSKLPSDKLIQCLAGSKEILPTPDSTLFKSRQSLFFMDMATTYRINHFNNNARKETDASKDIEKRRIFEGYGFFMQYFFKLMLVQLLSKAFVKGKFSVESILGQFQSSWLGVDYMHNINGESQVYNWVSLLAPAIVELQKEMTIEHYTGKHERYILVIDSLTLKVEGIIRDFANLQGIPTVRTKGDKNIEIGIEELLNNASVKETLGVQNHMLFTYLYSSEFGMNIRNNVAHGLYRYYDYNIFDAFIILFSLLRLSAYSLKQNNVNGKSSSTTNT